VDFLTYLLLLTGAAIGFARLVRALPGRALAQAWLERTWTAGKPLGCWTCLTGWGAMLALLMKPPGGVSWAFLLWLAATGLAATVLRRLDPITPESLFDDELPPLEEEED